MIWAHNLLDSKLHTENYFLKRAFGVQGSSLHVGMVIHLYKSV